LGGAIKWLQPLLAVTTAQISLGVSAKEEPKREGDLAARCMAEQVSGVFKKKSVSCQRKQDDQCGEETGLVVERGQDCPSTPKPK